MHKSDKHNERACARALKFLHERNADGLDYLLEYMEAARATATVDPAVLRREAWKEHNVRYGIKSQKGTVAEYIAQYIYNTHTPNALTIYPSDRKQQVTGVDGIINNRSRVNIKAAAGEYSPKWYQRTLRLASDYFEDRYEADYLMLVDMDIDPEAYVLYVFDYVPVRSAFYKLWARWDRDKQYAYVSLSELRDHLYQHMWIYREQTEEKYDHIS